MTAGRNTLIALIVMTACLVGLIVSVRQRHDINARRSVVRRAVAESVGMCALALSREGTATRDPLEGPAGCLGDIPGGYCLRDTCDVVTCPCPIGSSLTLEVVRMIR